MDLIDPATGKPLPEDAIRRDLFIDEPVHVYQIPPLTSMKGHNAKSWTDDPSRNIFTARLRVVETAFESPASDGGQGQPKLKVDLVLEDPYDGKLFAAAPYTNSSVVEPAVDSTRFFALTVRDPQGHKAVLGIGFEDRSKAIDLGIALQGARRVLGLESACADASEAKQESKDYSLKEGQTITVNIGSKSGRRRQPEPPSTSDPATLQSFALPPPPSAGSGLAMAQQGAGFPLPPPPSAKDVKRKRQSLRDLGFNDGKNGEFA
ncbi:adaptin ear-binding coat-associated protein 2 [Metarhizium acridum CQMa 102]|uniref:Adaptin ear-binding coat-associated protein 2 n=1 Tax=Metarhizium acridum (strain CQMa 102) TaxID=655827 RepID=E9EIC1_METAQ|nr:adaptin ear-binding coat-associated protein 2 [Metarhizium acridum CQMa 102]EFY84342.1 adaptin ear-binding coat-associated protein 2 [Metarhizium acridum CQMa 102]